MMFIQAPKQVRRTARMIAVVMASTLLAACQTFSGDGGLQVVQETAGSQLRKEIVAIKNDEVASMAYDRVTDILRRPLTADAAVQVALLNNRGIQAAYNELGLAEADMVRSSLPPNPTFSVERLSGPVEIEVEKRIIANILALATLPVRASIAADRFRQAQLRAAEETLRLAAETRRSYYRAVAASELAAFLAEAQRAAETATKLAQRLGETGALNKLDQAREQIFYAELTAQMAKVRQTASSERERLVRQMGLWGADLNFRLPGTLPTLPRRPLTMPAIEVEAVARRVDVQIKRIELEALAKSYGLTHATRFINLLEVSGISKTVKERAEGHKVTDRGFELELQIPLFDFGEVRVRQASETYAQATNLLTEKAVNVRSEARDAYRTYRSAYDIARHYQREVLPIRKIISDETLLRYNAMMIDVFALLVEARQRLNANIAAIEAKRDFWVANTNLGVAVVGGGGGGGDVMASGASGPSGGEAGAGH
jgi:outer membrane protein TolC/predicted small secreted protein